MYRCKAHRSSELTDTSDQGIQPPKRFKVWDKEKTGLTGQSFSTLNRSSPSSPTFSY